MILSDKMPIERRRFVKFCASAITAVGANPAALANGDDALTRYERVQLVDEQQRAFTAAQMQVGETYVFNYPYVSTPCFLVDLGKPVAYTEPLETADARSYVWQGGVGDNQSIVSFAAICAHKMTHPAKNVSFINYRHDEVSYRNTEKELVTSQQVIFCCSEKSVYDPAQGARVLGGPATQPLAAMLVEHNKDDDTLHALGTYGGEMYTQFFEKFGFRLAMELETNDVRKPVSGTSVVRTIAQYSANQMLC